MSNHLPTRGAATVSMIRTQLQQAEQFLRTRKFAEAETACRTALALDSRSAPAWQILGLSLAQRGDHDGAEQAFQQFLKVHPGTAAIYTNLGNIRLLKKDPAAAVPYYRKAIGLTPNYAEAHFNLGLALKGLDRANEAIESLNTALQYRPNYVDAYLHLGIAHLAINDNEAALAALDKALAIQPEHLESLYNRGLALGQLGRFQEAKISLARAVSKDENNHKVLYALGEVLHRMQDFNLATSALARAATLKPDDPDTHAALASVFTDDGWTMAALDEIEKAVALDPNSSFVHIVRGRVLGELSRLDEALASHERAVELAPDSLDALNALGTSYLSRGDVEKAREVFGRLEELHPDDPRVFIRTIRVNRFKSFEDPRMPRLEQVIADEAKLSNVDRITLHYAAGQTFDELGDVDRAFYHFTAANKLQAKDNTLSEDQYVAQQVRIREVFSPAFIRSREGVGSKSNLPIFVLGMPRSGTTLSEQIISSHPMVQGAGEVLDLDISIRVLSKRHNYTALMPELAAEFPPDHFAELGDIYSERLTRRAPGTPHVTDKQLSNYNRIGLIHLALPNAKIIHCMRNPVDCCVSIFTNHFNQLVEHSNDLTRLGRFFRRYHSLMAYWRETLPPGSFLDVQYEDTVNDLETQARQLIEYCGLEWDPRCLDFQSNKRQVTTLSITQVRQPIYRSSVERWRKYEKHLGPLLEALGDLAPPH